jgi:predicted Zn-dependent protease
MKYLKGKDFYFDMADSIISKCDNAGCEVLFSNSKSGLTRIANSTIHQNVSKRSTDVTIRVSRGDNIGTSSTNVITNEGLFDCLMNALEIMKSSEPLEGFPGPAQKAEYRTTDTYAEATVKFGPAERAKIVADAIARAKVDGLTLAGAVENAVGEIAFVNSNGVKVYQPLTSFGCNFVAMDGEGDDPPSGYAALAGRDVSKADWKATYDRACRKAVLARNPIEIEPGKYDVVLESAAFCELVMWFNYITFNSQSVMDGTSPMSGHSGDKITGKNVTIIDDAYGSILGGLPFDFEGVPRQVVPLIEEGVARTTVQSRFSAVKQGMEPTGHGFGPGSMPSNALPLNLRVTPGDKTINEMVGMLENGIQVTRFHYVNGLLDTRKAVMTGMTRDGAWLIENGKIKHAIKNLRFTDNMLEAWGRIEAIENVTHPVTGWWSAVGSYDIPGVLIREFTFTGKTGKGS